MRIVLSVLIIPFLILATALGADDDSKARSKPATSPAPSPSTSSSPAIEIIEGEAEALAFVRQNHPDLATVLETLKPMNPPEYRKAIGELSQVSRTLLLVKTRNSQRYELALETWKAKSRVELLAAQLAGSPVEEARSQLRLAIEAKIDVEIRRQKFELEQAELAAKKAREAIDRLENHRDAVVETRLRALQPKKMIKTKKSSPAKATNSPTKPIGEDRR